MTTKDQLRALAAVYRTLDAFREGLIAVMPAYAILFERNLQQLKVIIEANGWNTDPE